jgi:hypothetical protein
MICRRPAPGSLGAPVGSPWDDPGRYGVFGALGCFGFGGRLGVLSPISHLLPSEYAARRARAPGGSEMLRALGPAGGVRSAPS